MTRPAPALPTATVVICVYTEQRWDDIVAAVGSVQAQDVVPPRCSWSSTTTRRCSSARGRRSPTPVRVLPNAQRQGLSGARNTAVAAATGDVVVFLDDDAAARPGWLRALLAPYADPDVVAVGGVAHPRFPDGRPACCPPAARRRTRPASSTGSSAAPTPASPTAQAEVRNLMGCNMSLRRDGVRRGRRLRRGPRPDRAQPAGLRGDRALHPGPAGLPARGPARRGSCSSPPRRSTTG